MTFIKQYISIFLLNVSHTLAVQLFYNCKGLNICANFCTFWNWCTPFCACENWVLIYEQIEPIYTCVGTVSEGGNDNKSYEYQIVF